MKENHSEEGSFPTELGDLKKAIGTSPEQADETTKKLIRAYHDIGLVSLDADWSEGKRYWKKGPCVSTLTTFSGSDLAFAVILFKYWRGDGEVYADEENPRKKAGSKKPLKQVYGKERIKMQREYEGARKELNKLLKGGDGINDDKDEFVKGFDAWDKYLRENRILTGRDTLEDISTGKSVRAVSVDDDEEDVDKFDEFEEVFDIREV